MKNTYHMPGMKDAVMDTTITSFSGFVERMLYHDKGTGFSIMLVSAGCFAGPVTVKGTLPFVSTNDFVLCVGGWGNDAGGKQQFEASLVSYAVPTRLADIERYVEKGLAGGCGRTVARHMVRMFGEKLFQVIEDEPYRLYDVPGLTDEQVEEVVEGWKELAEIRSIMVFLQAYGLGADKAMKIFHTYGTGAIDIIKENPYRLIDAISGIGFKGVDDFALRLDFPRNGGARVAGAVRYVLNVLAGRGDCAVREDTLLASAAKTLGCRGADVAAALPELVAGGGVCRETVAGAVRYYRPDILRAERGVARHVERLWRVAQDGGYEGLIQQVEREAGRILSGSQRDAVRTALANKVAVITGGPGVGKTTVVDVVLRCFEKLGLSLLLCAPTGKAAKRMREVTGKEAVTIHRALDYDHAAEGFRHNERNQMAVDAVIIDEASMVDVLLMNDFVQALPDGARLIIVGDSDQLASVGPGSVLGDIIASGTVATARLTEVYRQGAGSLIIANAHRVNRGQMPLKPETAGLADFYFIPTSCGGTIRDKMMQVITERVPQAFGIDTGSIQVVSPMNKGELGVKALNKLLQGALNPAPASKVTRCGTVFGVGDRVIQMTNNYDRDVFNGETGTIVTVDSGTETVVVDYDGKRASYGFSELDELALAYAITVHRSQGSEYPVVVMPLAGEHDAMLERNLLYTGMTRGRKLVVVIGETAALEKAVKTVKATRRTTTLAERLKGLGEAVATPVAVANAA